MGLQSNQFYELHLYLATCNFLLLGGRAKGLLLAQKTLQKWTAISGETAASISSDHCLDQTCYCVCVFAHAAVCSLLLLQLPVSVTPQEYVYAHCFVWFFSSALVIPLSSFLDACLFLQVCFVQVAAVFSSWHNLFNLTCQMERFPNFAIW